MKNMKKVVTAIDKYEIYPTLFLFNGYHNSVAKNVIIPKITTVQ